MRKETFCSFRYIHSGGLETGEAEYRAEENKTWSSIQMCSFPKLISNPLFEDDATWKANSLWLSNRLRTPRTLLSKFVKELSSRGLATHPKSGEDQVLPDYLFKLNALVYSLVSSQRKTLDLALLLNLDESLNLIEDSLLDAIEFAGFGHINIFGKSCALSTLPEVECYSEDDDKIWNYVKLNSHAVDNKMLAFTNYVYNGEDPLQCGSFKDRHSALARFSTSCCDALFAKKAVNVKESCPFFEVTNFENLVIKQSWDLRLTNRAGVTFTGSCETLNGEFIVNQLSSCEQEAEVDLLQVRLDNGGNQSLIFEKVAKARIFIYSGFLMMSTLLGTGALLIFLVGIIITCVRLIPKSKTLKCVSERESLPSVEYPKFDPDPSLGQSLLVKLENNS